MNQRDNQAAQKQAFPKAILHVDGDAFFVSCELTRRPDLRGRAVVTGQERGMATAVNYVAKALGVVRGMRTADIRRNFPQVVILPSDYLLYAQYAERMYAIVRHYTDQVEEYSIDECFADLTDKAHFDASPEKQSRLYQSLARTIQADLFHSLGITFSVGLGVNKVTAKIASKWKKPFGLTVMPRQDIPDFLAQLPIGKVWGIGSATTVKLRNLGIANALDLYRRDRAWVAEHCDKPLAEIYEEFHGNFVKELQVASRDPSSVQRTRTFYPPVGANPAGRTFLWSQLSYHAEDACQRLRHQRLVAARVGFFLKTQEFQYIRGEALLPDPSASPEEILRAIEPEFEKLWRHVIENGSRRLLFRAAGIYLGGLGQADQGTQTLFGLPVKHKGSVIIHAAIDALTRRFGRNIISLGSSLKALKADGGRDDRAFNIIHLGAVG